MFQAQTPRPPPEPPPEPIPGVPPIPLPDKPPPPPPTEPPPPTMMAGKRGVAGRIKRYAGALGQSRGAEVLRVAGPLIALEEAERPKRGSAPSKRRESKTARERGILEQLPEGLLSDLSGMAEAISDHKARHVAAKQEASRQVEPEAAENVIRPAFTGRAS